MKKHIRLSLASLLVIAACGDDITSHPLDPSGPDAASAAVDAAGMTIDGGSSSSTAFVIGTDFFSGGIASTIEVPALTVTQNAIAGVASTDPVVRIFGNRAYIINRFGADNITIIDLTDLTLVEQVSTGAGSNPQDVAVVGSTIYVAALATPGLLLLDANNLQAGVVSSIDLSSLDPDDNLPNCSSLHRAGNKLYVACGILDDNDPFLTPRGAGRIGVININSNTTSAPLTLANNRPFGFIQRVGPDLAVPTVPNFGDPTEGCVERIKTGGNPSIDGCIVDNSDLGGYAGGMAVTSEGDLWVAVVEGFDSVDFGALGSLHKVDGATGDVAPSVTTSMQRPFDVAVCPSGQLVVADAGGGIRVYDAQGAELTTAVLDIGLPPVSNGIICY